MNHEELTSLIIKELGRHHDPKEITRKVCEESTLNWNEAQRLVDEVATQNKRQIAARQSPLLLVLSVATLLAGIGLLAYGIRFFFIVSHESTVMQVLSLRSGYYILGELATGVGMISGGLFGAWKTLANLLPEG